MSDMFILQNFNYTITFNDLEIEIRYKDMNYNYYFIIINNNDPFVINYLNNNINKLWDFIKENHKSNKIIFKLNKDGTYKMIIKEPIYLNYELIQIEKYKSDSRIDTLIEENKNLIKNIKELKEEIEELKIVKNRDLMKNIKEDIQELKTFKNRELMNHFHSKIYLNTYDKSSTYLKLNFHGNHATNLESLVLFSNLKKLEIIGNNISIITNFIGISELFEPLNKLKLEELIIANINNINNLDFIKKIETLQFIKLENLKELNNIVDLFTLSNLTKIIINNCPKIAFISSNLFKNHSILSIEQN